MADRRSAETLVRTGVFPESVRAAFEAVALKSTALKNALAENPGLTSDAWWKLYKPSVKKSTALSLVSRPLGTKERLHVITSDKRSTILEALIEHNELQLDEQQAVLTSPGFAVGVATKLLSASWCNPGLRRDLSFAAGGQTQLDWLASASPSEIPDREAEALLATFPTWGPVLDEDKPRGKRARSQALTALLHRRPALMAAAVAPGQHEAVIMAAAGCRHLSDESLQVQALGFDPDNLPPSFDFANLKYKLMALVNNPVATPRVVDAVIALAGSPAGRASYESFDLGDSAASRKAKHPFALTSDYETVSDASDIQWVCNRALPSDYKPEGRPFDVLALARNPHLQATTVRRVAQALVDVRSISEGEYEEANEFLARNHPEVHTEWRKDLYAERDLYLGRDSYPDPVPFTVENLMGVPCYALEQPHAAERVPTALSIVLGLTPTAWESFFSLVDEFDGTVGDLAELCVHL